MLRLLNWIKNFMIGLVSALLIHLVAYAVTHFPFDLAVHLGHIAGVIVWQHFFH